MRLPFPLRLQRRRGLLVYQLVLILIGVIILILFLLYIARRRPIGATASVAARTLAPELIAIRSSVDAVPRISLQVTPQSDASSLG